jgi:hypothetical protein
MNTYLVSIKTAGAERDTYVKAASAEAAIAKVRRTLTGLERRWAAVFVA